MNVCDHQFSWHFLHWMPICSPELRQEQDIFFAFQIVGGHIGLPILIIASVVLRKPRPDLTFLNLCFTWVFSSIVFSIGLVRLRRRIPGPYPTHNILFTDYARLYRKGSATMKFNGTLPYIHSDQECLSQAALTTGAQVMTDTAMCALIIQVAVHRLPSRYLTKDIIIQLWLDFRATIHGPRGSRQIQETRAVVRLTSCLKAMSLLKPI